MIKVYDGFTDDFSGQGLGYIMPTKAEVDEKPAGIYEIMLQIPIDESRDDWLIDHQRIIAAKSPTRISPEVNFGISGSIQRQIFKAKKSAQMYNLNNRKKKLKKYKKKTEFVRLEVDGDWYKVSTIKGGAAGWIKASVLEYEREAEDDVTDGENSKVFESVVAREQLFRIHNIKRDTQKMMVTVEAEHITYDLIGVICADEYAPEDIPADEVVAQLIAKADRKDLPFKIYCQCTNLITADYTGRNLIDCLLNPDDGIVAQCGARFIRDNFDIYILDMTNQYAGAEIRYGDNMRKASLETESGNAITRIRPVGKNKNGKRLYITENDGYVDSPNAGNFAVQRTKEIEYAEAQTGKKGLSSDSKTRARLKELALAEFENGADKIEAKIDAEFVRKELMIEYLDSANETALHMYDVTRIRARRAGIAADVRMAGYKFDALPGRERYIDAEITDLTELEPMIYGSNIGRSSISGSKIINNSIDGSQKIKDLSVGIGKFDVAAIDQLNANSITAITAQIQKIVSEELITDELYASIAEMIALKVETIVAGDVDADRLGAALAEISNAEIGSADIGFGQIKDLVAGTAIITEGVGGQLYIARLAVTEANMVSLTVGELVVKGKDGSLYSVSVDEDGNIQTDLKQIANDDVKDLSLNAGEKIIEGTVTSACLNAQEIFAENAIIQQLIAANMDVATLFAQDAFIAHLITTDISSNSYIQQSIIDEATGEIKKFARLEDDGLHVGGADAGCDVVINDDSVNVRVNGQVYSKFASNYAQFGNYQIRSSAGGGLIFKVKG